MGSKTIPSSRLEEFAIPKASLRKLYKEPRELPKEGQLNAGEKLEILSINLSSHEKFRK